MNNLSIVVGTRNDNHGGKLIERTNSFLNRLAFQLKKFSITNVELVIVEWNQIPSNPPLKDLLDFQEISKNCKVKIVTVEKKIHDMFENSEKLFFFQMIAKNVGIRHASNDFILVTNIDILFSDNFFHFLKNNKLKEKTIYRLERRDLSISYLKKYDFSDENYLNNKVNFVNKTHYTFDVKKKRKYFVTSSLVRYFYKLIYSYQDFGILITFEKVSKKIKKNIFNLKLFINYFKLFKNFIMVKLFAPKLFTNACGDFTLLDRNSWINLQGYDERPIYSWHIDSLFLWLAYYKNYKFYNFDKNICVFHLNHSFGGSEDIKSNLFEKLKEKKIPYLSNEDFLKIIQFYKKNKKHNFITENWGLVDNCDLKIEILN